MLFIYYTDIISFTIIYKNQSLAVKSFIYNKSEIFYKTEGEGNPLVLIHGFAEAGFVWNYQVEYLKNFFKVIVPDLPGYGKSTLLNIEPQKTTIEDYANCVYALIEHEKIDKCIIIGHSMGGYITLSVAEQYPEKITAFGFINSTAFADSEEKKQIRLKGIETIEKYGVYSFVKNTSPNLFTKQYKKENDNKIDELIELSKSYSITSLQQCYYAMMNRRDRTTVLKSKKFPVLFIIGKEDTAVPVSDILKQVSLPEISYIHILNNVSHMAMWEAADIVNDYLKEFVNEHV